VTYDIGEDGGTDFIVMEYVDGELLSERVAATVDRGHVFSRVRPELDLSEEALADAEPLLAVAVGLALPGGRA
jgi:hypothetical protein